MIVSSSIACSGLFIQSSGDNFYNALFSGVRTNFCDTTSGDISLENVTIDSSAALSALANDSNVHMANCILANVTNLGYGVNITGNSPNGFYRCPMFGTGVTNTFYPFQTVGAGNYYLAGGCNFTNAGTTNYIDSTLLADLGTKTTHPPTAYLNTTIATNTNWAPQVPRDTNAAPDLGYHYDPLDYLVGDVSVQGQATLTLTNGVTVGVCCGCCGNGLTVMGSLFSQGTVENWNHLVSGSLVQEQPNATPASLICNNYYGGWTVSGGWQDIDLRFTDLAMPGAVGYLLLVTDEDGLSAPGGPITFQDCQLHGGQLFFSLGASGPSSGTLSMTNNLIDRCQVSLTKNWDPSAFCVNQYNNLYHGGVLNLYCDISQDTNVGTNWWFYDNLFEGDNINEDGNDSGSPPYWTDTFSAGYNGYDNSYIMVYDCYTVSELLNSSGGDQYLSEADYQPGPLGDYYYPAANGTLTLLIHAGSRSAAAAGLYHYTVTPDQTIEGANTVSIGYHYVAVDANGNPIDTNGDGIPDYLEDANGNGIYDAGDLGNWLISPFNGLTTTNGLLVFTPLK